ncbi:hypothetical protein J2T29_002409 [Kerstersia gyiorum]|nr:hypothetical protein [Kerstersia gyiorum]MCW2187778.1 hypothetical protein [Kerstersia gyiorum]
MRGEHANVVWSRVICAGSSPHARGTRVLLWTVQFRARFIPACAGNTSGRCGQRQGSGGSSPHARGTRQGGRTGGLRPTVHPRMRGEHSGRCGQRQGSGGSSPHARGTHPIGAVLVGQPRFIPACAGNTQTWSGRGSSAPVHPRMRGEHNAAQVAMPQQGGSSPHARGTRADRREGRSKRRFIPACAGNTQTWSGRGSSAPVHPRMRGEHK